RSGLYSAEVCSLKRNTGRGYTVRMSTLDSAQQAEIGGRVYRRADFVHLDFPAGAIAYCTLPGDVKVEGVTYVAGVLIGISGIRNSADRKANRIALNLMADNSTFLCAIEGNIQYSHMTYAIAVLDEDNQIITGLIRIGSALVSTPRLVISEGDVSLELSCESETVRFLRPRRIIAQDADQQWRFPGDVGLSLVPRVPRSQAEWGGEMQTPSAGSAGLISRSVAVHRTMNLH